MILSDYEKRELAMLCNLLGSKDADERATAALKASKFVKECGLNWFEILGVRTIPRDTEIDDKIEFLLQHPELLTPWQRDFTVNIDGNFDMLSTAQLRVLCDTFDQALRKQRKAEKAKATSEAQANTPTDSVTPYLCNEAPIV